MSQDRRRSNRQSSTPWTTRWLESLRSHPTQSSTTDEDQITEEMPAVRLDAKPQSHLKQ